MKVVTVVGTRPEIIRLSRVIAALERYTQHVLVHTGQNYDYELNQVFFNDLEMREPDHFLAAAGKSAAETVGLVIARVDEVLAVEKPDAILILGDTNSCLAAYPAKRRKIEDMSLLLQSAITALEKVGLMLNVQAANLERVLAVLPALHDPTVSNLSAKGWLAVNTILDESVVREIIPRLKDAGAQGIVEYPLNKIVM